jgi:hypothetical protein
MAIALPETRLAQATLLDMTAMIDLLEPVFRSRTPVPSSGASSIQAVLLEAIEKAIAHGQTSVEVKRRVSLPLLRSSRRVHCIRRLTLRSIKFSADAICPPDVNVWIAAVLNRHEDYATARQCFDSASAPICFCRVIQMAFLRLMREIA